MRVLVSLEQRYQRTPDGRLWTSTSHPYTFWTRYLEVFGQVDVLARVLEVGKAEPQWARADGPGVNFIPVPYFFGPQQYARHIFKVRRGIADSLANSEAVIMRVPSLVGQTLSASLRRSGHPFGLEVVGDPYDVFAPGAGIKHPLRPFFRHWFSSHLRHQCREARAVAYVTEYALQRRYPASAHMTGVSDVVLPDSAFTTNYSSVQLKSNQILSTDRERMPGERCVLAFVGSLEQLYKAPDVLIKATAIAIRRGRDLQLRIVGEGRYKSTLEELARSLGIADRCEFLGQIPGGAGVQEVLDSSDIFVLPSHVEGLPRAMVEAMARGLPCIGTQVGGIPELLDPAYLVPSGDIDALAAKIEELVANPLQRKLASERNRLEANKYCDESLRLRRLQFWLSVRDFTVAWQQRTKCKSRLCNPAPHET
jgi:glycosyltransferase involved in cell wall biosynthesis